MIRCRVGDGCWGNKFYKDEETGEDMIEDEVFRKRRFVPSKMDSLGFQKSGDQYCYETDFMNGEFHVILSVSKEGNVTSEVIEKMNNEEYVQLRSEHFNGAYVNTVRDAYRQLLEHIGDAVCREVLFASEQANRITEMILNQYDVKPDFPWETTQYQSYGAFRHADTRKWFALIMNVKRGKLLKDKDRTTVDIINLKTDTLENDISKYPGVVFPGYHMNHKTWISIMLSDYLEDRMVMEYVQRSFELTK